MNVRRLLAHAVLGLMLLLGQQYATHHWLSHAIEATQAKAKGAPADHCAECDALVAFSATISAPPAPAVPLPAPGVDTLPKAATPVAADGAPSPYRSRAPPALG